MPKMTGKQLVAFCRSKMNTPYVYGCKGEFLTQKKYADLKRMYGSAVWDSDSNKIGKICVDCSGLISWACGVVRGSGQWFDSATKRMPISTIKDAPVGAMVWMKGHIGVYVGMKNGVPYYIAADGSAYGVREVPLSYNKFTHWILDEKTFSYETEKQKVVDDEVVTKETIIVNGKEHTVNMIRKDGLTYIKIRDFANATGFNVSNKGKIPVLSK